MNKTLTQLHNAALMLGSVADPDLDAELLLAALLNCRREALWSTDVAWVPALERRFAEGIERRKNGEPLAYIIGRKAFADLIFEVNRSVLIPRPETEELVAWVEQWMRPEHTVVADIGCGCGNIAITMSHRHPACSALGCDVSFSAIQVAQRNRDRLNANVKFFQGDLLAPLIERKIAPSILIANLPYLDPRLPHDPSIAAEPAHALFALDGIGQMLRLLDQLGQLPGLPEFIFFETDPRNSNHRVRHRGYIQQIKKDLAGHDRFIALRRISES